MSDENKFGKSDVGCYADSARGIYIGQDVVIPMAEDYGFKASKCDCPRCSNQDGGAYAQCEFYNEIWDEAESFLNTLTEDGIYFGSTENGDWGLWETEEE